jgi:hypothetical protein
MEMKPLMLYKYGKAHPITFNIYHYYNNGNLLVGLITHENGYPKPLQDLTTNFTDIKCEPDCAYIDVANNGREIIEWLFSNGLGHLTGGMERSGFVVYPEFKFNMDRLKEFTNGGTMEMDDEEPEFESYWRDATTDNRKGNYSEFGDD